MQNLKSRAKSSGRLVIPLRGKLRYFSQSNRRQKQQEEPCCAADIPAGIRPDKPGDGGDRQHNDRGEIPGGITHARPPRASQDEQRRNDRDKKEDVIEIQREAKTLNKSYIVTWFAAPNVVTFFAFVTLCNRF